MVLYYSCKELREAKKTEEEIREILLSAPKRKALLLHYDIGFAYENCNFLDRAEREFKTTCELLNSFHFFIGKSRLLGRTHFHLGCIYRKMGKEEMAKYHFEECLRFIPDHGKASQNLASIYYILKITPSHTERSKPYTLLYYNLGSIYEKEGLLVKAKENFETVLKLLGKAYFFSGRRKIMGGAHFHLGCIYRKMGKEEMAKYHFEECLRFIPEHRKAKENLEGNR
jgi:tetratricopeptide (TPR) repeat protein